MTTASGPPSPPFSGPGIRVIDHCKRQPTMPLVYPRDPGLTFGRLRRSIAGSPGEACQLCGIRRGGRVEDHDPDRRVVGHEQGRAVEGQRPGAGWRNRLSLRSGPWRCRCWPRTGRSRGIAGPAVRAGRSRPGRRGGRSSRPGTWRRAWRPPVPSRRSGCASGVGEAKVQHVRGAERPWFEVAEQQPGGPVAGHDVEPGRDGVRRGWLEALHERVQPGTAAGAGAPVWSSPPRAWSSGSRASANRCSRSWVSSRSASAIAVSTLAEGRAWRPCSSPCTRSNRRWRAGRPLPGADPGPAGSQSASPTSAGRSRARRERRNAPSSRRRSRTAPRGRADLLIARRRTHDEPRIPHPSGRLPGSGATRSGRRRMAHPRARPH